MRNLADLQKECEKLGLPVKFAGKRPAKSDFVKVLREFHLKRDYPTGMPFDEIEPMLCFAEWNLKPEEQKRIWADNNGWVAQRKLNGCRLILHFVPGVGVFAHSRTVSLKTYRMQELTDKLLFSDFKGLLPCAMVLDVETMVEKSIDTRNYTAKGEVTKSSLHSTTAILHLDSIQSKKLQREQDAPLMFKVFDVIRWGGEKGENTQYHTRLRWVHEAVAALKVTEVGKYFDEVAVEPNGKRAMFEKIVEEGGEGIVLKNLASTYEANSSRLRTAWVKAKKRVEFDAFVTGFKRGDKDAGFENLVGALEFSVNTERGVHVLGYPINMTLEERKRITMYLPETNEVRMITSMYDRVAEISGQDISAREFRLSHCTVDKWRDQAGDEKRAEDCKVNMEELKQAAEWVG